MNSKKVTGKCLCKAVEVNFTLETDSFGVCHCGMCRKWSGGSALSVEGGKDIAFKGEEFIKVYGSSDWAERGFCKRCGTHLFYRLKSGSYINFPLGLLEGVEHLKFDLQIFVDRKPGQYSFSDKTKMMTEAQVVERFLSPKGWG